MTAWDERKETLPGPAKADIKDILKEMFSDATRVFVGPPEVYDKLVIDLIAMAARHEGKSITPALIEELRAEVGEIVGEYDKYICEWPNDGR